jgi:hypothetical protein
VARPRTVRIPFVGGQREDIDRKLLPAGYLTRAKNVRLRKDGRWGVRYGDTAVTLTSNLAGTLVPQDLIPFDDRLHALGDANSATPAAPATDIHEFVEHAQFAWKASDPDALHARLGLVTGVRDMGRPPSMGASVDVIDCAASEGLVCLVFELGSVSWVHIFEAESDSTLLLAQLSITKPRVITIGDTFFVGGISGTTIDLYKYDPDTDDAMVTLTDIFAAGAAIGWWDFAANSAGNGAVAVVHRTTPTTSIAKLNSSGTVTATFAGAATAFLRGTIADTTSFIVLVVVETAGQTVDMYSFTQAGAANLGPTNIFGTTTTAVQPGIVNQSVSATEVMAIYAETFNTGPSNDVRFESRRVTDHVLIDQDTWAESALTTKPNTHATAKEFVQVFGGVQAEGTAGAILRGNFLGLMQQQAIGAYKDRFQAGLTALTQTPALARDSTTGKFYWPNLVVDDDARQIPIVTEFQLGSTERRQTVDMGGSLYIFGGAPQLFDTRQLIEAGYQETPVLHDVLASNGIGSLPSSTVLTIAGKWEWFDSRGYKHESPLSIVATVTMGASDDTIAGSISVPHSLRCNGTVQVSAAKAIIYRSVSGKRQLRRALALDVATFGDDVAFTLIGSDASIAANEIVYTQGGRGALGDTLEHEGPRPADYATRFGKRILSGGLPNPFEWQVSKPEFPNEPINWSDDAAFRGTIPDRVRGVAALDTQAFIFARKAVYTFTGEGPDETAQGAFSDPVELPGALGLHNADSLVETPVGIMYQADEEKIALIPNGAAGSQWFGQAVRDTLRAFPVITAAVVCPGEQLVTFACNNTGGTDGRLIHYDLRANIWIVDEFDGSTPITSVAEYQGRLARLSEGVITLANTTHPAAAFIEHGLTTGPIVLNEWGKLVNITLTGEFRGNCILTCLISYDDGKSWTTLEAFTLSTANGLVAGDMVQRQWWPRRRKGDRFMLDFQATALAGAASEGFAFTEATLSIIDGKGETRLSTGKRG